MADGRLGAPRFQNLPPPSTVLCMYRYSTSIRTIAVFFQSSKLSTRTSQVTEHWSAFLCLVVSINMEDDSSSSNSNHDIVVEVGDDVRLEGANEDDFFVGKVVCKNEETLGVHWYYRVSVALYCIALLDGLRCIA